MERINRILENKLYRECLEKIRECEKNRIFCHHDMGHFLDVARLAYLMDLEEGMDISREMIYAAALLHDIGRFRQYQDGTPHEIASGEIAPLILQESGFDEDEIEGVVEAIVNHRNAAVKERRDLTGVLYRGDKMSRSCFGCPVCEQCNWDDAKKNLQLRR